MENEKKQECTKCKTIKDISNFSYRKTGRNKVNSICKICVKENRKKYLNREKEYNKKYYQENIERYLKYGIEYSKKYCKTEIGKAKSKNKNHKRRELVKTSNITTNQLLKLQQNAKKCYWCGISIKNIKTHIDHYEPLSKGGKHSISNLVISCEKCNIRKKDKDPINFANSVGKLL